MRTIAKAAGYTPGAIYAYFPSKEHIYAAALGRIVGPTTHRDRIRRCPGTPVERFIAAGLAFYDFYNTNPRDLDLGFYLFRGGIRPQGLSDELNTELNTKLLATLDPVRAAAHDHGVTAEQARMLTADVWRTPQACCSSPTPDASHSSSSTPDN